MSVQGESEKPLWESVKKGNKLALSTLYDQNFQILYEYGFRICQKKELVEDAIQELFIKLWGKRNEIVIAGSVRSYLLVSIRNAVFNEVKKEKNQSLISFGDIDLDFKIDYTVDSEFFKESTSDDQVVALMEGLNKLTGRQKEILYLKFFQGLSQDEIATIMGITVKASYKLSARALATLKNLMGISGPILIAILQNWKRL